MLGLICFPHFRGHRCANEPSFTGYPAGRESGGALGGDAQRT